MILKNGRVETGRILKTLGLETVGFNPNRSSSNFKNGRVRSIGFNPRVRSISNFGIDEVVVV
jgi:hypothetical protein